MKLKEIIDNAKKIVVFTGAGISVPSGIPDFRSSEGLYSKEFGNISPEEILSHSFFINNTKDFYIFYKKNMIYKDAKPNLAHEYFAKIDATIVTQNIDNLHTIAGNKKVYELHGNINRNYCMKCQKFYSLKDLDFKDIPKCSCGGIIKPDVVLYEEPLNNEIVANSIKAISEADLLIVVGTSLTVYPAASYIRFFKGEKMVLINKQKTPYDNIADMVFYEDVVELIKKIQIKKTTL